MIIIYTYFYRLISSEKILYGNPPFSVPYQFTQKVNYPRGFYISNLLKISMLLFIWISFLIIFINK